jgi:hypothetical protein
MLFLLRNCKVEETMVCNLHRCSNVFSLVYLYIVIQHNDLHPRRTTLYDVHSICADKMLKQFQRCEQYFIALPRPP